MHNPHTLKKKIETINNQFQLLSARIRHLHQTCKITIPLLPLPNSANFGTTTFQSDGNVIINSNVLRTIETTYRQSQDEGIKSSLCWPHNYNRTPLSCKINIVFKGQ